MGRRIAAIIAQWFNGLHVGAKITQMIFTPTSLQMQIGGLLDWYKKYLMIFLGFFILGLIRKNSGSCPFSNACGLRILDLATFIQIDGETPLCRVIGFSPDRSLSKLV